MQLKEQDQDEEEDGQMMEQDETNERKQRKRGHKLSLTCVCVDSQGKHAFTGSKDGSIIKWCLGSRKILNKINPIKKQEAETDERSAKRFHVKHINCIAISSDDKFLATGGWDKHIRIWSPSTMKWVHTFTLHRQEVTALAFRQDHPSLYSGSADRSVMLWTLEEDDNRCFIDALYGHESVITSIDALRKERVLTSGGRDQTLRIWKIVEQAQTVFQTKHESVDIVRFIDDKTFVSGGEDGTITVWTTMKRSPVYSLINAHGKGGQEVVETSASLKFWINALATFPVKGASKQSRPSKRQKLDAGEKTTRYDDDDGSDNEDKSDQSDADDPDVDDSSDRILGLVASGSCDTHLNIWKLVKNEGKYELVLHQSHECRGFINDLRFSSDGTKIIAACGQEHRFGRWWKLKGASNNSMRVFDVAKIT